MESPLNLYIHGRGSVEESGSGPKEGSIKNLKEVKLRKEVYRIKTHICILEYMWNIHAGKVRKPGR